MKKSLLLFTLTLMAISPIFSQIMFEEEIDITDFETTEFVMPPSPLTTQVLFIGGYDIVQTTPTYGNPAGRAIAKEWHDFIGFTPDTTGEALGWVSVNHEMIYQDDRIGDGGGMTAFRVSKDAEGQLVVDEQTLSDGRTGHFFNVDFANTVGETGMNCAGISAPNGRIWTAEEWFRSNTGSIYNGNFRGANRPDSWNPHNPAPSAAGYGVRDTATFVINTPEFPLIDGDTINKYDNFNYMVEIDPREAVAIRKQYNWGRAGWEGGAITADGQYAYLGIDGNPAPWVRVTAATPWDFTDVTVEVYKEDTTVGNRWLEVDMTDTDNIFGGLTTKAWELGATMYNRNEWVTIDQETGIVYWTETGRDNIGDTWDDEIADFGVLPGSHHEAYAQETQGISATDVAYADYYGRVLYYDPATEEVGVVIHGGPFFDAEVPAADYPSKHLTNPDGINILTVNGKSFLMIQEDANGTSNGRMPEGISNRLCELYLLPVEARDASVDSLVRVTAVPAGAEITGAIQIDDNTILVNSQHPNADNPFPFNHSLTMAIHGFATEGLVTSLSNPSINSINALEIFPNPTTRSVFLSDKTDFALYNSEGRRIRVYRNTNEADVSDLSTGVYFIITSDKRSFKLLVK